MICSSVLLWAYIKRYSQNRTDSLLLLLLYVFQSLWKSQQILQTFSKKNQNHHRRFTQVFIFVRNQGVKISCKKLYYQLSGDLNIISISLNGWFLAVLHKSNFFERDFLAHPFHILCNTSWLCSMIITKVISFSCIIKFLLDR